ncbi:MAG: AbrB/MazE/SpoVT family DNA-binding domain-containing protein [Verrucomicrobiota bacterium]
MITTLTGKNQITIPAAFAARYRMQRGTRIEWIAGAAPDEFQCRVVPDPATLARELYGAGRKYLQSGTQDPVAELIAERAQDDAMREGSL